jgi:hypothetical protein
MASTLLSRKRLAPTSSTRRKPDNAINFLRSWLPPAARFVAQLLLLVAGVWLVAFAVAIWLNPESETIATVHEESTVTVVAPAAAASLAAAATTPQQGQSPATAAPAPTTQTTETKTDKTTKTTTPPASKRSDLLITTLLAIGAAGVLVGVFLSRITGIKVAGVEVALAAKVAGIVAAKTTPKNPDQKAKTGVATLRALRAAEELGASTGDDVVLEQLADEALDKTFGAGNVPPP